MKHHRLLLSVTLALLLLVGLGTQAGAILGLNGGVLPFPNTSRNGFDQYFPVQMYQGYYNSQLAWYFCTDVNYPKLALDTLAEFLRFGLGDAAALQNDVLIGPQLVDVFIRAQGLNYTPRLTEAAGSVATMYLNLSFDQGPLFTAMPGDATYSGVWQVTFVKFRPGVTPHVITNTGPYDPVTNPTGLPEAGVDADYLVTPADTPLPGIVQNTPVIFKCPIVAVGRLGGPWYPVPSNATDIIYRIPQGKVLPTYAQTKILLLPIWEVYCRDAVHRNVQNVAILIPGVWDPTGVLTAKLGANNAPGLALIPAAAEQNFYHLLPPGPISQLPVIEACPNFAAFPRPVPSDYTPVMRYVPLVRRNIPPWSIFNNPTYIENLLATVPPAPGLEVAPGPEVILDGPVVPPSFLILVYQLGR